MITPDAEVFAALQDADYWAGAEYEPDVRIHRHKEAFEQIFGEKESVWSPEKNATRIPLVLRGTIDELENDEDRLVTTLKPGMCLPHMEPGEGLLRLTVDQLDFRRRLHFQRVRRMGSAAYELFEKFDGRDRKKFVDADRFTGRVEAMGSNLFYDGLSARHQANSSDGRGFIASRHVVYVASLMEDDLMAGYEANFFGNTIRGIVAQIYSERHKVGQVYHGRSYPVGFYKKIVEAKVIKPGGLKEVLPAPAPAPARVPGIRVIPATA